MHPSMKMGLVLFAHGARDPRWARPFEAVAQRVRSARPDALVRLAFLELMSPDLATAGAELVAEGCTRIEVLPLFLGTGGHVRKDLPVLVDGLRSAHAGTHIELHEAVGELDAVIGAIAQAAISTLDTPR